MDTYYEQVVTDRVSIRFFDKNVPEEDLVWHRDREDRDVSLFCWEAAGWKLQFENKLPEPIVAGLNYRIPKMTFHRLIKGEGSIALRINKLSTKEV